MQEKVFCGVGASTPYVLAKAGAEVTLENPRGVSLTHMNVRGELSKACAVVEASRDVFLHNGVDERIALKLSLLRVLPPAFSALGAFLGKLEYYKREDKLDFLLAKDSACVKLAEGSV